MQPFGDMAAVASGNVPAALAERKLDVLVLDDNEFDQELIRRSASRLSLPLETHAVPTIGAFRSALDAKRFDMAIIDCNLPEGDGFEAVSIARGHPLNGGIPAIMVTGQPVARRAVSAIRSGFVDYLPKDEIASPAFSEAILTALSDSAAPARDLTDAERKEMARDVLRGVSRACLEDMAPKIRTVRNDLIALARGGDIPRRQLEEVLLNSIFACDELGDAIKELSEYVEVWTEVRH